jgi:hypothetical protein
MKYCFLLFLLLIGCCVRPQPRTYIISKEIEGEEKEIVKEI